MKYLVAANWKMNKTVSDALDFVNKLRPSASKSNAEVLVLPPYTALDAVGKEIEDSSLLMGAQNVSEHDNGAFTGEISATMLEACGCSHVVVGHSERRHIMKESNKTINKKVLKCLQEGLHVILCVGETEEERDLDETEDIVDEQLKECLKSVSAEQLSQVTLAYEPVWAIGTGNTATADQAEDVHAFIRAAVTQLYSEEVAKNCRIIYGGSVKPSNAQELFSKPNIHGAIVGTCALDVNEFIPIVEAVPEEKK